jgi:hypothetical protein
MTNEELDEARVRAERIRRHRFAARLAREGWTPPEPVDPDVLAFREWIETSPYREEEDDALCQTYLAGARMARERERERAKVLVEFVGGVTTLGSNDSISAIVGVARFTLAKYRGEA